MHALGGNRGIGCQTCITGFGHRGGKKRPHLGNKALKPEVSYHNSDN